MHNEPIRSITFFNFINELRLGKFPGRECLPCDAIGPLILTDEQKKEIRSVILQRRALMDEYVEKVILPISGYTTLAQYLQIESDHAQKEKSDLLNEPQT